MRLRTNPVDGAEMVFIPAGEFLMGDDDMTDNPRRTVELSGYWIYRNLVTVTQFETFCRAAGSQMPEPPTFNPGWKQADHPMVNITWDAADAYARWAGAGLPSEAQWEKAARGADGRRYPWGDEFDADRLWCSKAELGDARGTHRVGELGVSPYGCTDMAGNAWQWCRDWYAPDFWKSSAADGPDPENRTYGEKRGHVPRGGSWGGYYPDYFRTAYRGLPPTCRVNVVGFRCVIRADLDE